MHDIDISTDVHVPHILLVDDEESLRDILSDVLTEVGHRVTTAASAEQALIRLSEQPVDVVITDIRMSGMNGIDLLRAIKENTPETQVIVITSYPSLNSALAALRAGAYDYLIKPFEDLEIIPAVVNRALEQKRLTHENQGLLETLQKYNAELEEVNKTLRDLAIRDALTGLYNYHYFHECLLKEAARAKRHQQRFSLLLIDVDHFKRYNDRHGYLRGDDLLRELAKIVTARLRGCDVAARYGGEEFALILPETPKFGARALAEDIRIQVSANRFVGDTEGAAQPTTISVGLASFPDDGDGPEEIVQAADRALRRAKHSGRNVVHWLENGPWPEVGGRPQRS